MNDEACPCCRQSHNTTACHAVGKSAVQRFVMRELPDLRSVHDHGPHSAYCKVCWYPVYALWIDKEPHNGECMNGCKNAVDCPEAKAKAETSAAVSKYKALHTSA